MDGTLRATKEKTYHNPSACVTHTIASTMTSEYQQIRSVLERSLQELDKELQAAQMPEYQAKEAKFHPTDDPQWRGSAGLSRARRNAVASLESLTAMLKSPAEAVMEHCWSVSGSG